MIHRLSLTPQGTPGASPLSGLDHRTLLIVWAFFMVLLMSIEKYDIVRTLSLGAFPVFAAVASGIPPGWLLQRIFLISPFLVLTAIANPFLDRTTIATIGTMPVTGGMISAGVIVAKATIALAGMLILDRCISVVGLCDALRRFGVPTVFTTQLLLMHRYVFLIAFEAAAMLKARDLRSSGKKGRGPFVTANLLGALLLRSSERSDRIYKAMLARGFSGTLPISHPHGFRIDDALFIISSIAGLSVLRFIL